MASGTQGLVEALEEARETIASMQAWIDNVKTSALLHTVIVMVGNGYAIIASEKGLLKVHPPKGMQLTVGMGVVVHQQSGQIIEQLELPPAGKITSLRRRVNDDVVEVELQGERTSVYAGKVGEAKIGDNVMLDSTGKVVIAALGKGSDENIHAEATHVTFDQIAGLHDAKRELTDAIVLPHKHPEVFAYYNKKPPKGIMLYGPPGCGKTMLAKAAATALAEVCAHKGVGAGFIYVKGPEILDRFVGVAEATVRRIFAQARAYAAEAGHPAMIFIDEADAILGVRGSGKSSDMERTIVPAFLAEMDGLEPAGAIVLLATNRPDTLDPAVTRDGRIDRKIKVPRPDTTAATDIFQLNLVPIPTGNGMNHAQMALNATKELFDPKRILYHIKTKDGKKYPFTLQQIINGGMIASIVDQASSLAMHRDLKEGKSTGIVMQDLYDAIDAAQKQNIELNHDNEVEEFLATNAGGAEVTELQMN